MSGVINTLVPTIERHTGGPRWAIKQLSVRKSAAFILFYFIFCKVQPVPTVEEAQIWWQDVIHLVRWLWAGFVAVPEVGPPQLSVKALSAGQIESVAGAIKGTAGHADRKLLISLFLP